MVAYLFWEQMVVGSNLTIPKTLLLIKYFYMPQFDFYSFAPQISWLFVGFFIFYFFLVKIIIPAVFVSYKLNSKI